MEDLRSAKLSENLQAVFRNGGKDNINCFIASRSLVRALYKRAQEVMNITSLSDTKDEAGFNFSEGILFALNTLFTEEAINMDDEEWIKQKGQMFIATLVGDNTEINTDSKGWIKDNSIW